MSESEPKEQNDAVEKVVTEDRPELAAKLSELEILSQSLKESQEKEKVTYNQLLKSMAEFQDFRKRNDKRLIEVRLNGRKDVLESIVSLCDVLDHAQDASQKAADIESIKQGLVLVKKQFEKFLGEQKVQPIKSVGETLDPNCHEVVAQEANDELEEGTIIAEIQKGYKLEDYVLRPARVRVSVKAK